MKKPNKGNGKLRWMPDSEAIFCPLCSVTFTVFTRKHHCRKCGKVFCDQCSDHKINVPEHGFRKPVRVCSKCAEVGFFLAPAETTENKYDEIAYENTQQDVDEETQRHQQHQQQHLAKLKQNNRDWNKVKSSHSGPIPTAATVQSFFLPPFAKMITLSDGSVIQRGLLNFIIRSATGKGVPINPIPSYIPTSQRTSPELITKTGPFFKMAFEDSKTFLRGELKIKGIELSWDVENEGEGRARMTSGSSVRVVENSQDNCIEISTYEGSTQIWKLVNGHNPSQDRQNTKIVVYFRFGTVAERDQWVLAIQHNMYAYLMSDDNFIQVKQKFISFAKQVGVVGAENMNWESILDNLYSSK